MRERVLILGIGNLVLRDEGVGIHAVQALEKEQLPSHVEVLDGGTGGVGIIGVLQELDRIVMIDATLDDSPAGTIKKIKPKFSKDYPQLLSSHEFGLRDMIESMIVQENIPEIDLITISLKNYQERGIDLSHEVESVIQTVLKMVREMV